MVILRKVTGRITGHIILTWWKAFYRFSLTKFAALDVYGMGIDMEGGKVEASFLGNISVSYQFAAKKDYIPGEYAVEKIVVTYKDGRTVEAVGSVTGADAEAIRDGFAESIVVEIK